MSKIMNAVKDGMLRAADWVEDHPWWTLAIMAVLLVLAVL